MKPSLLVLMGVVGLVACSAAGAETVRLYVGGPLKRFGLLKPGVHRYLRYVINKDGSRSALDIWQRRLSFETDPTIGPVVHMVQRWDESGSKAVLIQDSFFRPITLAPITHVRHVQSEGKIQIGGYRFTAGKVVGMAELPDNRRKDFVMPMPEPSFNFEYDMELLQALPLSSGRIFDIPFYDAGVDKKPDRYRFIVAGSAKIGDWNGPGVDCWLVTADYNTGKTISRFWFAKKSQVLVREEGVQADGSTLVKALLPPEAGDSPPS